MKSQNFFTAKKLFFVGISIAITAAFFDLLSKRVIFAILERLAAENGEQNPEIKICDFFSLVYVWNHGVSFGMFSGIEHGQIIFSVIQFSILIILFFWLANSDKLHIIWALGLISGGALGNLIDRINNAAVADFLDFHIASYHWPAFNLADSFVFIGVMILIFEDLIFKQNGKKTS
jgi:signal peptidase II